MSLFFDRVQQHQLEWRGEPMPLPVFCYNNRTLAAIFTASTRKVKELLAVPGARPIELFPGRCLVAFNCFEYRDTDIGPYNEVAISFLVRHNGWHVPGLTPLIQLFRRRLTAYVWQLPVNTEIARAGGLEIYGYPKFLANVQFTTQNDRFRCVVEEEGNLVCSVEGPVIPTRPQSPLRFVTYSMKNDIPLVANIIQNPLAAGLKYLRRDVVLTLGRDHWVGKRLSEINLTSRSIAYYYSPKNEAMLFAARNLIDD